MPVQYLLPKGERVLAGPGGFYNHTLTLVDYLYKELNDGAGNDAPPVHDGDATFIQIAFQFARCWPIMQLHGIPDDGIINSLTVTVVAKCNVITAPIPSVAVMVGIEPNSYENPASVLFVSNLTSTAYTAYSGSSITNPLTGAAWTVAGLRNLILTLYGDSGTNVRTWRATQIYATVDYTIPTHSQKVPSPLMS
jgi:hypothetical protein